MKAIWVQFPYGRPLPSSGGFWLPEMSDGIADLAGFAPGTCKPPFYIHRPKALNIISAWRTFPYARYRFPDLN